MPDAVGVICTQVLTYTFNIAHLTLHYPKGVLLGFAKEPLGCITKNGLIAI